MTRRRQGQLLLNACRWTPARIERWRRELEARGPLSVEDEQPLDDWMRWNIHRLTDAHCCSVPRRSFAVSNKIPMAPGGDALSLVAKLRQLEERLRAIDTELANCRPIPRLDPAIIEDRLTQWRRLLRASKTQGRTVLQRVLRGRLIFTPHVNPVSKEIDGYEFEGPTRLYQLLTGLAVERPKGLPDSRAGYEGITHEDTFDSDYGRLLEKRFHAEVLASPTRVVPEWTRKVPGEVKAA